MKNKETVNLSLEKKRELMNKKFPQNPLSRSSIYKIQKKVLKFSYKRISKYRIEIKNKNRHLLDKIVFIDKFLSLLEDKYNEIIIIDG